VVCKRCKCQIYVQNVTEKHHEIRSESLLAIYRVY
jgi:hypothetical protein